MKRRLSILVIEIIGIILFAVPVLIMHLIMSIDMYFWEKKNQAQNLDESKPGP